MVASEQGAAPWVPQSMVTGLGPGAVHLWYVDLGLPPETMSRIQGALSPEERDRAARMGASEVRHCFTAARGVLRSILAGYLGIPPGSIAIRYRPGGKPELEPSGTVDLRFNVSHASRHALIAITRGLEVGVDIECPRPIDDPTRLANRILTPAEARFLDSVPTHGREQHLLVFWTRKEALAKARGLGIFRSAPRDLDLGGSESLAEWRPLRPPPDRDLWSLRSIQPPVAGCVGAVAVEGRAADLETLTWRPTI